MAEIIKQQTRAGLIVVGEGKEKDRLRQQVIKNGLRDNIIFEPWTDDLTSYYKSADLYLLTSNYEGYAMSAVEASLCGCPVVMTDVGCAGEVIRSIGHTPGDRSYCRCGACDRCGATCRHRHACLLKNTAVFLTLTAYGVCPGRCIDRVYAG